MAAVETHEGSSISGYRSDFSVYYGHRNLPWVFVKTTPALLSWLVLPGHLVINLASLVVAASRGQFRIIWRAKKDSVAQIGAVWQKRREIQSTGKATSASIWKLLDKSLFKRKPK